MASGRCVCKSPPWQQPRKSLARQAAPVLASLRVRACVSPTSRLCSSCFTFGLCFACAWLTPERLAVHGSSPADVLRVQHHRCTQRACTDAYWRGHNECGHRLVRFARSAVCTQCGLHAVRFARSAVCTQCGLHAVRGQKKHPPSARTRNSRFLSVPFSTQVLGTGPRHTISAHVLVARIWCTGNAGGCRRVGVDPRRAAPVA
jgi:hypothetical protein